jgi:hypothetical protein
MKMNMKEIYEREWPSDEEAIACKKLHVASLYRMLPEEVKLLEGFAIRDKALARIEQELWRLAGCPEDAEVSLISDENVECFDGEGMVLEERLPQGWVLVAHNLDDPIIKLYKGMQPIASWYASFRGVYQAGGYIIEGDRAFFATDIVLPDFKVNELIETTPRFLACAKIAKEGLLNDWAYIPKGKKAL